MLGHALRGFGPILGLLVLLAWPPPAPGADTDRPGIHPNPQESVPLHDQTWFLATLGTLLVAFAASTTLLVRARIKLANHARTLEARVKERTAELTADIERRSRAEAAAQASQQQFHRLFHSIPLISAITAHPGGGYIDVNHAFVEALGFSLPEGLGRTALELGVWARPEERAAIIQSIRLGQPVRGVECQLRAKSGRLLTVLTSVEPIEFDGNPALLFVSLDISARIQLEADLRQSHKLEAIGLLSGGIAHDFNNILGAILGNAQIASLELPPDHPATACLSQITLSIRRASDLVKQILAFARQEPLRKTPTNLGDILRETHAFLRATLPASVELSLDLPETPCCITADPTQIHQALVNLVTNAWHALHQPSGRIRVQLSTVEVDAALATRVPALKPGPHHRISVEDNGHGMDPETLKRAFDPFFTTKEPGRGTGLGLSVVHGIVHAHNGAISVHNTPGAGTRFDLYLPASMLSPEPVPHPTPPHVQAPAPTGIQRGNGQRILFIDDEGPIVRTCSSALRRFGYTVASFTSPTEALLEFHAHPEAFQLVITDFSMPQKSGTDVAREILQVRPDLPLIITSGFISEQMQREIHAAGIRHVLRKPATLEEFSVAVHHALHPNAHA